MKVSNKYAKLQQTTYEFTDFDVQEALMLKHRIPPYIKGRKITFEMDESGARITLVYEEEDDERQDIQDGDQPHPPDREA